MTSSTKAPHLVSVTASFSLDMSDHNDIELTSSSTSLLRRKRSTSSDSDDEINDEEYVQEQLSATLWSDIVKSVYQARFTAPLLAILGVVFAYQMTIAPYRTDMVGGAASSNINDLVRWSHRLYSGVLIKI